MAPLIGYAAAAELAKEALASHRGIAELVIERGLLDSQKMEAALSATSLAGLG
ncbi:aspartate ammonia-lyase [compost metagenome]